MSTKQVMNLSDHGENLSEKLSNNFENDLDDAEFESKWEFPKPHKYLGTVLRSGAVRPLSPTLKVHSPESVIPGLAVLREGVNGIREWKNTIEFVRFFSRKINIFDSRHHWDMRTKFLEVRLRCMEKIVEDPDAVYPKHDGKFYVRLPPAVQKVLKAKEMKMARDGENFVKKVRVMNEDYYIGQINCANKDVDDDSGGKLCDKGGNKDEKQLDGETNVDLKSPRGHGLQKHSAGKLILSSKAKESIAKINKRIYSTANREKVESWIRNKHQYVNNVEDSSTRKRESSNSLNEEDPEMNLNLYREIWRREKEKQRKNAEDEKLKRESLQKGLNIDISHKIVRVMPETSRECEQSRNDDVHDVEVVEKACSPSLVNELVDCGPIADKDSETVNELSSKSETLSCQVKDELVLEDFNDKEDVVPEGNLPSACTLQLESPRESTSLRAVEVTNEPTGEVLVQEQNLVERPRQTRLQRLRRRIQNLFPCFTRNRVMPVDI